MPIALESISTYLPFTEKVKIILNISSGEMATWLKAFHSLFLALKLNVQKPVQYVLLLRKFWINISSESIGK